MKHINILAALAACIPLGLATPADTASSLSSTSNAPNIFSKLAVSSSIGGKAICFTGKVPIKAQANNMIITAEPLPDGPTFTEWLADHLFDVNITDTFNGGRRQVSGTYNINARFCVPKNADFKNGAPTLQFMTAGVTFDSSYWELAKGNSYVDTAAEAGYATFTYDRLGTGKSDFPNPIETVQSFMHLSIAHQLVQAIRNTSYRGIRFTKIVGVGHSFGSALTIGMTAQYPSDFDALILTGWYTASNTSNSAKLAAWTMLPANSAPNAPTGLSKLPAGYILFSSRPGWDLTFLTSPNYNTALASAVYAARNPMTVGELLTFGKSLVAPAPKFKGPIMIINGDHDFVFCGGHCDSPRLGGTDPFPTLFPARNVQGSQYVLVKGVGHVINLHNAAGEAYGKMVGFLKGNGL